jgi:hypothetical protein
MRKTITSLLMTKSLLKRKKKEQTEETEIDPEFLDIVEATDLFRARLRRDMAEREWTHKEDFKAKYLEVVEQLKQKLQLSRERGRLAEMIEYTLFSVEAHLKPEPESWLQRWGEGILALRVEIVITLKDWG